MKRREIQTRIPNTFVNIGHFYMETGDYEKALLLFNEAIALSKQFNIVSMEAEAQQELSKYYERLGDFKQALSCFKNAVELLEKQRTAEAKRKLAMYEVSDA